MNDDAPGGGLDRFLQAQETTFEAALRELTAGRKTSHWMWFVFPQIAGLGRSETARFYAIGDLDEARAYLAHPVLGERLRGCVRALLEHRDRSARAILGDPDDLKLCSSLTLFETASTGDDDRRLFADALNAFFAGRRDGATLGRV
ncbi:MAG TPA: DUF1810 domain-containing protein [Caulobacteraceae bacterium]|nr:DUF1810 domain-containing protein [Caulobacteraceae bacterium]